LGRGGLLSPHLAAWAANLLFLTVGAALLLQKRH
jgi:lipopolysaccharide export LptBFGC system permease protein LptF